MSALDESESGAGDVVPPVTAEPAPALMPPQTTPERYGYQPDRKRFASAFLVTTLIHVVMLFAVLTWHVAVRVRPATRPLTMTLLPLDPPARPDHKPVRRQKIKLASRKLPVARPVHTPPIPAAPAAVVPMPPPLPAAALTIPTPPPVVMPAANSAPDAAPPSLPTRSAGKDSWEARVVARLESLKHYPPAARSRREQGVATVRFRVNRQGILLFVSLEGSSGSRLLDQEALATIARAQPYPAIPAGRPDEIEVVVPIEFFLGRRGIG